MSTDTTSTTDTTDSKPATWAGVSLDCADPAALSRFWAEALSLPVLYTTDDFVLLGEPGATALGFCRVPDYAPPTWPEGDRAKQAHIEVGVTDLDAGAARMVALGATLAATQPAPDRWRVLLDPAGHPFCVYRQQ